MKRRNKFQIFQDLCEKKAEKFRLQLEKETKEKVKELAISVGVDMELTQHSCYVTDPRYNDRERNAFTTKTDIRFQPFQDMIYHLSDELQLDLCFQIENGKFKWW
jgi:hypothetical protein